ncbi:transcriptional regulator [Aureibacillus halotolerans]|uniref:RinA family phage transcriptional activator n=1 Tax=Aureibacillus halotolerans TaxID=1508390 RepID=A0A4R6U390_9BACI|nr:transcriptional regulator [Aureibacillus halotolerans]TDQ39223.1 RinA family phage transcriptional activator [Aureibacillus halotolerans]
MTTAIKKATFKHVEAELFQYHETKREILKRREEILHAPRGRDENIGGGRSSEPGRPTERIATRLLSDVRLRSLEEVVDAIETSFEQLPEHYQEVIKLKYWSGKSYTWAQIADKAYVHPNTATKMRKEIVYLVAAKLGWG